ncbi:MAG: hypothetical protein KY452_01575 [Actinobacteria bacterium]|nr:hypothetical protein [Actinomycetota bacterium]
MASEPLSGERYSLREAAALLGITPEGVKKRIRSSGLKHLTGGESDGQWWVDRGDVEDARAALLDSLRAVDARPGFASTTERPQDEEAETLRADAEKLRAALHAMVIAAGDLQNADRAHLDALRQFVVPSTPND